MAEHPQSFFLAPITGAPTDGTSEVQTFTIAGGPPTTLTFAFRKDGVPTGAIAWSATNATLLASMNTAFDAAYGTGSIVATAGTLTAGIGTVTLTFGGKLARLAVATLTVTKVAETGTATTLSVAETTPGVTGTHRDAPPGALVRSSNGNVYRNSSTTSNAPTWVTI